MEEIDGALRWSPKVPGFKVRLLYTRHAEGLLDDELLDDVASSLWHRSRDIVIATDAMRGRATCPRCGATLTHDGRPRSALSCRSGFEMRWRAYQRSFRDRELWGGNATESFRAFRARPADCSYRLREGHPDRPRGSRGHRSVKAGHLTRRAVSNLIEGPADEVIRLLEGLAYGPGAEPEIRQTREDWLGLAHRAGRRAIAERAARAARSIET